MGEIFKVFTYDTAFVSELLAHRACVLANKRSLREYHKRDGVISKLGASGQRRQLLIENNAVGSPRPGKEDEMESLHSL